MEAIVSRETIARQAGRAAELAAANPKASPPPNPFCEHLQPEHHDCWECDFRRQFDALTAPEGTEAGA